MFEVPAIDIRLYDQDRGRFAQELGRALEDVSVVQVSGLNQGLVDGLYEISEALTAEPAIKYSGSSKTKDTHTTQLFILKYFNIESHLNKLIYEIQKNMKDINRKISVGFDLYFNDELCIASTGEADLFLGKHIPNNKNPDDEVIFMEKHTDKNRDKTLLPRATKPGLQGLIEGEWHDLEPQSGNVLVFAAEGFPYRKVTPLVHRVVNKNPFNQSRKSIVYGS